MLPSPTAGSGTSPKRRSQPANETNTQRAHSLISSLYRRPKKQQARESSSRAFPSSDRLVARGLEHEPPASVGQPAESSGIAKALCERDLGADDPVVATRIERDHLAPTATDVADHRADLV